MPGVPEDDLPNELSGKRVSEDDLSHEKPHTTTKGVIDAITRGASPYVIGGATGAGMGSVVPGVGTALGAGAGVAAVGLTDLASHLYNPVASKLGWKSMMTPKELSDKMLEKVGVGKPSTAAERVVESAAGAATGGGLGAGAYKTLAENAQPGLLKGVLAEMGKGPKSQAVSGALAGTAGQTTKELGGGPWTQLMASIAAGSVPGLTGALFGQPFRGASGTPQIQQRVQEARDIGVKPDIAYSAPSLVNRSITKALSSTEEMQNHLSNTNKALETEANRIATNIGEVSNPNMAGKRLAAALGKEDGGFLSNVAAVEGKLWDKWWGNVKPGAEMKVDKTMSFLENSQKDRAGAEALGELMKDKEAARLLEAFRSDAGPRKSTLVGPDGKPMQSPAKGTIPYETIKELRSIVGEKLDPTQMVAADARRSTLKQLYGALSEDMKSYAKTLGPEAEKDFNRASMVTRGKHDRIDTYLQKTQGKEPAEVWRYATDPKAVQDGGFRFLAINRSLSGDQRDMFHATFVSQMGKDAQGNFDPALFAKNYRELTPTVRGALLPENQRPAMDRLIRVIDGMQKTGMLAKQSDATPHVGAYMIMGALLHAHPGALLTVGMASAKSEQLAKMITDPKVIDYIAGVNRVPTSQAAIAVNAFAQQIRKQDGEEDKKK